MKRVFTVCTSLLAMILLANAANGAAVVKIDDEAQVKIGFRVQPLVVITDKDIDGDGDFEQEVDFKVRRGRLRLGADVNEFISAFLQTDLGSGVGGSGFDWRVIDAWVSLKACDKLKLIAGENMVPASRQNLTSSGALMAIDRPGINYKSLTWGTRSVTAFANNNFGDADAGLRGDVDVRDLGVTLFGATPINDDLSIKYYAGIYNGIQEAGEDNLRYAGRIQLNIFDTEPGYFNSSTYMDGKKTIGIGLSLDGQSEVAASADEGLVDYGFYTLDVFANMPAGPGYITFEAAYENLDLDDATLMDHDGDATTATKDASQSQGDGYYVQVGYYINKVQPWIEYETWDSDAASGLGGYDMYRVGATYFFKGHNANVKAGYEKLDADETISGTVSEDSIESIVAGIYVTY